jgi:hypothetical protein
VAQLQHPRGLQPQEEVTRRTPAPTPPSMRAGAGDRRDSNGTAWHRGGKRGPRAKEAEVVATREGERRATDREWREDRASWECCRVFLV